MAGSIHRTVSAWVEAAIFFLPSLFAQAAPANPSIVFDAPKAGQVYAPGETVTVILRVEAPLKEKTTDALLAVPGYGLMRAAVIDIGTGVFQWNIAIPKEYAGAFTLTPMVVAGEDPAHPGQPLTVEGAPLTIAVAPREAPSSLRIPNPYYFLQWPVSRHEQLYAAGVYATGERDVTSSVTGTRWYSSDPGVARVSSEGDVTVVALGTATVTADNHGVKAFASFVVEDPAHPLPPQDVTGGVKIEKSKITIDREAKAYGQYPLSAQTITVTNNSDFPIAGPLYLAVSDLSAGVWLWLKTPNLPPNPPPGMIRYSRLRPKPGKPMAIRLEPKDGLRINPAESVRVTLYFLINQPGVRPDCKLSVIRATKL